jgi:hypothetical protein
MNRGGCAEPSTGSKGKNDRAGSSAGDRSPREVGERRGNGT